MFTDKKSALHSVIVCFTNGTIVWLPVTDKISSCSMKALSQVIDLSGPGPEETIEEMALSKVMCQA